MNGSYKPVNCSFYDQLEAFGVQKKKVHITYRGEQGVKEELNGIIQTFFIQNKAEYLQMENGFTLRLDYITSVREI
jgi:Rho-binding antiterminator